MKMPNVLETHGLVQENAGASTGADWGQTQDQGRIISYSPIDAQPIAGVYKSSKKDYQWIMDTAAAAF